MSDAMRALQIKIGAGSDGQFGPNTAKKIAYHYKLSPKRASHLLGQAHHESGGFKLVRENLYYSTPERIKAVWPSRFPTVESAEKYAKNPKGLAGKVYVGRMGNRDETDASNFAGKGFMMLTGRDNYRLFASKMALPEVMTDPDLVAEKYAFETAIFFFEENNLFDIADKGVNPETIQRITRRVNGGIHGIEDRENQTHKVYTWLTS